MRLALSVLALTVITGTAAAQPASGLAASSPTPSLLAGTPAYDISTFGDLIRLCTTDRSATTYEASLGLCAGYVSGVLDYHLVDTGWSGGRHNRRVCLPLERPTRLETIQSLIAWDSTHARFNSEPAADGVMRYFMAIYPCPGARSATQTERTPG